MQFLVYRIPQSITGLDDAGMDLQAAQLSTRTGQEVRSTANLSWPDWQLPMFVVLCAIGGAILFTFLVRFQFYITHCIWLGKIFMSNFISLSGFVMAAETNVAWKRYRGWWQERFGRGRCCRSSRKAYQACKRINWMGSSTCSKTIHSVCSDCPISHTSYWFTRGMFHYLE